MCIFGLRPSRRLLVGRLLRGITSRASPSFLSLPFLCPFFPRFLFILGSLSPTSIPRDRDEVGVGFISVRYHMTLRLELSTRLFADAISGYIARCASRFIPRSLSERKRKKRKDNMYIYMYITWAVTVTDGHAQVRAKSARVWALGGGKGKEAKRDGGARTGEGRPHGQVQGGRRRNRIGYECCSLLSCSTIGDGNHLGTWRGLGAPLAYKYIYVQSPGSTKRRRLR